MRFILVIPQTYIKHQMFARSCAKLEVYKDKQQQNAILIKHNELMT